MANLIGDPEAGFRGHTLIILNHMQRLLRDFDVIDRTGFGKDDAQLGRCMTQKREAGADDAPLVVCIACRRKDAKAVQRRCESLYVTQRGEHRRKAQLFKLTVSWKAIAACDAFAKST